MFERIKFVKYIKFFESRDTYCNDINVAWISSPKSDLLKFVKSKFRHAFCFSYICKKDVLSFCKNAVSFWYTIVYIVNSSVFYYIWQLWLITCKSSSTFCTRKCKKQYYVCWNYNDTSIIYINLNMALLKVKNHYTLIYNKTFDNKLRLAVELFLHLWVQFLLCLLHPVIHDWESSIF